MTARGKKWLTGAGAVLLLLAATTVITLSILGKRFEPYIREQMIAYLRQRFDSEVELSAIHIRIPSVSPFQAILHRGLGTLAQVEGANLILRYKGRTDMPPVVALKRFHFSIDIGTLFESRKVVKGLVLDGLEIHVPPKDERPQMSGRASGDKPAEGSTHRGIVINEVIAPDALLVILPRDKSRTPLRFEIHYLRLQSTDKDIAMKYEAVLRNPKPPGEIHSNGTFGPWNSKEPGDTPLAGDYTFANADLAVFSGIAGILNSAGSFEGTLSSVSARGKASVKDFRLKMAGNPVPLSTTFEALVDGTNGNTILKPVHATLAGTNFTTSGSVIKHDGDKHRTITLDVNMPAGRLEDLLRLAMKGSPLMTGQIALLCKVGIPPVDGKVRQKLLLDGQFSVSQGQFLQPKIQDQIDSLSRRGQGQPENEEIDAVFSQMKGDFKLEDRVITFRTLSFFVPGANVDLAGNLGMESHLLDFHGTLRMRARVSQTMSGWKRWLLKPADPFFAKNGAGTLLRIKVDGTSAAPKFGLDRGGSPAKVPNAGQ